MTATWKASALRWLPTFLGFPLGGFTAELIAGPVDDLAAALARGRRHRRHPRRRPGVGHGPERAAGPALDRRDRRGPRPRGSRSGRRPSDYGTSLGDLVVQGAICGLAIGAAQALTLRGRAAYLWAPALSALWALGWAITTSIGVDVETQ